jgi:hypothetical protein
MSDELSRSQSLESDIADWCRTGEACVLLGTPGKPASRSTLYQAVKRGIIEPPVKFGSRINFFRRSKLLAARERGFDGSSIRPPRGREKDGA